MTAKKSFWETLKGKIVAATAAIVLLTGLITGLTSLVGGLTDLREKIAGFVKPWRRQTGAETIAVVTRYPKVLPLSLKNTLDSQQPPDLLYWFRLEGANKSKDTIHIEVTFSVINGPASARATPIPYDMEPQKPFKKSPIPPIDFTTWEPQNALIVSWRASKETGGIIGQGTTQPIELLPRNVIDWDLQTPEEGPVPASFKLAWLRAWVITSQKEAERLSQEVEAGVDTRSPAGNVARQYMARCYTRLFAGAAPLRVLPQPLPLPGHGRQTIRTATSLLDARSGNALEAALLVAGISRTFLSGVNAGLALFGLPSGQSTAGEKVLLLGWQPPGGAYSAVEINRASELDFAANSEQATKRLNAVLPTEKGLLEALDNEGSFVSADGSIAAVDLREPEKKQRYRIYGLP